MVEVVNGGAGERLRVPFLTDDTRAFRILKSCQNRVGLLFCLELYLAGFVARKRCLKRLF